MSNRICYTDNGVQQSAGDSTGFIVEQLVLDNTSLLADNIYTKANNGVYEIKINSTGDIYTEKLDVVIPSRIVIDNDTTVALDITLTSKPSKEVNLALSSSSSDFSFTPSNITYSPDDFISTQTIRITGNNVGTGNINVSVTTDDCIFSSIEDKTLSVDVVTPTPLPEEIWAARWQTDGFSSTIDSYFTGDFSSSTPSSDEFWFAIKAETNMIPTTSGTFVPITGTREPDVVTESATVASGSFLGPAWNNHRFWVIYNGIGASSVVYNTATEGPFEVAPTWNAGDWIVWGVQNVDNNLVLRVYEGSTGRNIVHPVGDPFIPKINEATSLHIAHDYGRIANSIRELSGAEISSVFFGEGGFPSDSELSEFRNADSKYRASDFSGSVQELIHEAWGFNSSMIINDVGNTTMTEVDLDNDITFVRVNN